MQEPPRHGLISTPPRVSPPHMEPLRLISMGHPPLPGPKDPPWACLHPHLAMALPEACLLPQAMDPPPGTGHLLGPCPHRRTRDEGAAGAGAEAGGFCVVGRVQVVASVCCMVIYAGCDMHVDHLKNFTGWQWTPCSGVECFQHMCTIASTLKAKGAAGRLEDKFEHEGVVSIADMLDRGAVQHTWIISIS